MSLASHLVTLRNKHSELSKRIEEMQRSPGSNYLEIAQLKRQKLRLKEDMKRLSNDRRLTNVTLPERMLENLEEDPKPETTVTTAENPGNNPVDLAA